MIKKIGINVGSGKRIMPSTDKVRWINVDQHGQNFNDWAKCNDINDTGFIKHTLARMVIKPENGKYVVKVEGKPLPFDDECIDFVNASHLVEDFLYEFEPVMEDFFRVLKPGGELIINVPYGASWGSFHHKRQFVKNTFEGYAIQNSFYQDKRSWSACKVKVKRLGLITCVVWFVLGKSGKTISNGVWGAYNKPGLFKRVIDFFYLFDLKIGKKWEIKAVLTK